MIGFIWFIVGLTIIAIAAPFIVKIFFPHHMTWKEVGISIVISIVLSIATVLIVMYAGKFNTEILNGKVTKKDQVTVSCEHSYQVCSGSGENKTCSTHYEHFQDYDWRVYTTVGELNINRVDRQGVKEPPRFSKVQVGEHAAIENSYVDYLKGQESSLLYKKNHQTDSEFEKLVPRYPNVYDYYRSDPVIFTGVKVDSQTKKAYNKALTDALRELGNQKQVNVVVVFAGTERAEFGEYLRNAWRNGRKNDQVIVIGTTNFPEVSWSYAFGWSKEQTVNSSLKYDFNELETIDSKTMVSLIETNVRKHFKRRPMEEFKSYLWETKVEWWKLLIVVLVQLAVNIGIAVYMVRNDTQTGFRSRSLNTRFRRRR